MLPVAGAAWAGAGAAITFPEHAGVWAVVLWAAAVAFLGVALRRARPTVLALVAVSFAVAAAAASHVALAQPARDAVAGLEVDGGRSVTFEVDVVGKVERSATGYRFDAITRSATVGDDARPVSAPVVVRTPERAPGLDLGARATVTGTAFRADPGDRAVLVIEASALLVDRPPSGPLGVAATLRTGLVAAVAGLPDPGAGLVPGLAVGDTSAVSDELDQQMKASSLSHLTAVSGANCEKGGALSDATGPSLSLPLKDYDSHTISRRRRADMRDGFRGYFRPSAAELDELWQQGEIVIDANVLLHLFRYPASLRQQLISLLQKQRDRLWLPHQVALEFHRGRWNVIGEQEAKFDAVDKALADAQAPILEAIKELHRLEAAESEALRQKLADALRMFEQALHDHRADWGSHDDIFTAVVDLYDRRVGAPFDAEQLQTARTEGAARFEKRIPPGFADQSKLEEDLRYGDYLLWKQLLEHVAETQKSVIFVTDDGKEDWWIRSSGKQRSPRPELVEEFHDASGGRRIHIYNVKQFLLFAADRGEPVSPEAAEEARRAQELTEREAERRALYDAAGRAAARNLTEAVRSSPGYSVGDAIAAIDRRRDAGSTEHLDALRRAYNLSSPSDRADRIAETLRAALPTRVSELDDKELAAQRRFIEETIAKLVQRTSDEVSEE